MKEFTCVFFGRKKNALGVKYVCEVAVKAENEAKAKLACYDTHEHIWGGVDGIRTKEVDGEAPVLQIPGEFL
jgi:hypothetical protein